MYQKLKLYISELILHRSLNQ